ncbi:MAG: histidine kinase [Pseudomonadota bacterium]|nr:histidine kinase [Pseudomonadota bacterium]
MLRYAMRVGKGFQQPSGRVIALGRLMLATLFLIAIRVDASQPALAPAATYALLLGYIALAAAIVAATWRNWWLDARLAGPAHAADIILFVLLVLLTEGYTSPFFTFFMFVLLSAAIRWGWRATALTALLLTLLYSLAGLLVLASDEGFDLRSYIVRTGHLVSLSLILMWFGVNQWRTRLYARDEQVFANPSLDELPLETGLRAAMRGVRASAGAFVWREQLGDDVAGVVLRAGELAPVSFAGSPFAEAFATTPFLYDIARNRSLRRDAERNLIAFAASDAVGADAAVSLALSEGIAIPVRSDGGEGVLFLEQVRNLSTDHIDLGEQIAADVAAHFQRRTLLTAVEESAEARSRVTLARDLHDSVVQFLAGAAFRLEAIKRSAGAGRPVEPELNELKQLMLQEQGELRAFITALRSGSQVAFSDLARDMAALGERLSRQWDVACQFSARPARLMIPTRIHLDALQLMREAVANAVRHADAKTVKIKLAAAGGALLLEFVNDDADLPPRGERLDTPVSLKERVEQAGGTLDMARGMGVTKVSISLPIDGRHR